MPLYLSGVFRFLIGAAVGSFLNVLASRYEEETGFRKAFQGRSFCDSCRKTLKWYELLPMLSFITQGSKCRSCGARIPIKYFLVEVLAGLIAVLIPLQIGFTALTVVWLTVFWMLLLVSVIDLRLGVIPNSLVIIVLLSGVSGLIYRYATGYVSQVEAVPGVDLLGHYSMVLRFGPNPLVNHLAAIIAGAALFGGIYLLSRGKAMGFGDVKLVGALGALIMWPDILVALITPFLVGSLVGLPLLIKKKIKFKSSIPFGPFIAIGVTLTFFFGYDIVNAYFRLFSLV